MSLWKNERWNYTAYPFRETMGKPKPLISKTSECLATANEYNPLREGKYHPGCKSQGMEAEGGWSCLAGWGWQSLSCVGSSGLSSHHSADCHGWHHPSLPGSLLARVLLGFLPTTVPCALCLLLQVFSYFDGCLWLFTVVCLLDIHTHIPLQYTLRLGFWYDIPRSKNYHWCHMSVVLSTQLSPSQTS